MFAYARAFAYELGLVLATGAAILGLVIVNGPSTGPALLHMETAIAVIAWILSSVVLLDHERKSW